MKMRGIISLLLMIVFFIVSLTGIGLHLAPTGRVARLAGWSFLGISKDTLTKIHTITGYIMIGLVIVHIMLNYGIFKHEIGALFEPRREKKRL